MVVFDATKDSLEDIKSVKIGAKNLLNLDLNQKLLNYRDIDRKEDKNCFIQYGKFSLPQKLQDYNKIKLN